MDPLVWSDPNPYGGRTAEGPEGEWRLQARDVVSIEFQPVPPDGMEFIDVHNSLKDHPGRAAFDEAYQRAGHPIGHGLDNLAYAETFDEAYQLVEALRRGSDGLAPWREQLADAGFSVKHPSSPQLANLHSRRIKSGSMDVMVHEGDTDVRIHVSYHGDGAMSWHNIASVTARWSGQTGRIVHTSLPAGTDPFAIGVAHALSIMEQRLARGNVRFSKPLGDKHKRYGI